MTNFRTAIASYSFHSLLAEGKCDVFNYLNMLKYRYNVFNADIWTGYLPSACPIYLGGAVKWRVKLQGNLRGVWKSSACGWYLELWTDP